MSDNSYIYSTKDISRYYDLTAKGLAYYEEQNLISPMRTGTAGYRVYTLDDCYSLYHSKLYANAGLSLKQTAELLRCDDEDMILDTLEKQIALEQKKLKQQEVILDHLSKIRILVEDYRTNGQSFRIVDRPELYRLYVRNYDEEHVSSKEQSHDFAQWNQVIPADTASLRYSMDSVLSDCEDMDVNIGNVVRREIFDLFEFRETDRVEFLPSCTCIETVLCGSSEEINHRGWLTSTLNYIQENGYRLCGDVITAMVLVTGSKDHRNRYELAWFPVEKI